MSKETAIHDGAETLSRFFHLPGKHSQKKHVGGKRGRASVRKAAEAFRRFFDFGDGE